MNNYKMMTRNEFEKQLLVALAKNSNENYDNIHDLLTAVNSSLVPSGDETIEHGWENLYTEPGDYDDNGGDLVGICQINDLTFLGILNGYDYEIPVFSIFYYDTDDKLRKYIPEDGNIYCKEHRCGIGSCLNDDFTNKHSIYEHYYNPTYNWGEMTKDIVRHFGLGDITQ